MRKPIAWTRNAALDVGWTLLLIGAFILRSIGWFRFWHKRCRRCCRRAGDWWTVWEEVGDVGCYEVFAWKCERCGFRWTTKVWRT